MKQMRHLRYNMRPEREVQSDKKRIAGVSHWPVCQARMGLFLLKLFKFNI